MRWSSSLASLAGLKPACLVCGLLLRSACPSHHRHRAVFTSSHPSLSPAHETDLLIPLHHVCCQLSRYEVRAINASSIGHTRPSHSRFCSQDQPERIRSAGFSSGTELAIIVVAGYPLQCLRVCVHHHTYPPRTVQCCDRCLWSSC